MRLLLSRIAWHVAAVASSSAWTAQSQKQQRISQSHPWESVNALLVSLPVDGAAHSQDEFKVQGDRFKKIVAKNEITHAAVSSVQPASRSARGIVCSPPVVT